AGPEGRSRARRLPARPLAGPAAAAALGTSPPPVQGRGKRHGSLLPRRAGLRYNNKAIRPGAPTERRGEAGPVRGLLGGKASPAAFFATFAAHVGRFCKPSLRNGRFAKPSYFQVTPVRAHHLAVVATAQVLVSLVIDGLAQESNRPVRQGE